MDVKIFPFSGEKFTLSQAKVIGPSMIVGESEGYTTVVNFQTAMTEPIIFPKTSVSVQEQATELAKIFKGKKVIAGFNLAGAAEVLEMEFDEMSSKDKATTYELKVDVADIKGLTILGTYKEKYIDFDDEDDDEVEVSYEDEVEFPIYWIDYMYLKDTEAEEEEAELVIEEEVGVVKL